MIGVRINENSSGNSSKKYVTYRDAQRHFGFIGDLWQDFSASVDSPPVPDVTFMPGHFHHDWSIEL